MKILKFGGKSLGNGSPLEKSTEIIKTESSIDSVGVVVSARGETTDLLLSIYQLASRGQDYSKQWSKFVKYQTLEISKSEIEVQLEALSQILIALRNLSIDSPAIKDRVVAFGEVISAITVVNKLRKIGVKAFYKDSREILFVNNDASDNVDYDTSEYHTKRYFETLSAGEVPIITGYIASDSKGETATLGRNGSNFSATLIASFIDASEVQNWTDIDGIYSANPKYVESAVKIESLSYSEANELANFGVNILHPKTITPLKNKNIPLKIYNSFDWTKPGTIITEKGSKKGIKAVSVIENTSLITFEGKGLLGKIGIDARIFTVLSSNNISVRLISQASSEVGIGFIVDSEDAKLAIQVLNAEFITELINGDLASITLNNDTAIIAIVGKHNYALEKAIKGLRRNKIWLHLISNSISGHHISLVIDSEHIKKAVNIVHSEVFGVRKTINLVALGKGTVGGKLIDQIIETHEDVTSRRNLKVNIVAIVDSKKMIFNEAGIGENWREELASSNLNRSLTPLIQSIQKSGLENVVFADNTASQEITEQYPDFVNAGFDIVASNKKGNSSSLEFYNELRNLLNRKDKQFLYETNVGAGLPVIDPIRQLYNSADEIRSIRGVFSGSLSYIFNNFSASDVSFSEVLLKAKAGGFTEPDPREDLSGQDVARKLLILAREVGAQVELADVEIQNLIPTELRNEGEFEDFIKRNLELDSHYENLKENLKSNEVLRYVGNLDLVENKMTVELVTAKADSPLGSIKNADSIIEIYTQNYGDQPIVIQGAGAGANVTANGVYSDLLRIGAQM